MKLTVLPGGRIVAVYSDALDLSLLGSVKISRASHVEPDDSGRWHADLSPVGGPKLGPFTKRGEALQAEQDWLNEHLPSL